MNTNAPTTSGNASVPDPVLRSPGKNRPHGESTRSGVLTVRGLTKTYGRARPPWMPCEQSTSTSPPGKCSS